MPCLEYALDVLSDIDADIHFTCRMVDVIKKLKIFFIFSSHDCFPSGNQMFLFCQRVQH